MMCLLAAALPVLLRVDLLTYEEGGLLIDYLPIPEPEIHDEFSYLLGADTFASGRLANPTHPMWVHFETFHVNHQPTYGSKYPPAQSLFLALGQRAFGHPWYGVLLSVSLMCGSICWMLQGWLRPHYAFLGSLLAIADFGVSSYWTNSYWGGAVAAAGGALVLGALPRLVRRQSPSAALLAVGGGVLLFNSRPYEGMVLTLTVCAALLWWRRRQGQPLAGLFTKRLVAPAGILLAAAVIWVGYYNWRTTGTPWLMPYAVHERAYATNSPFWALPERPAITYRHEIFNNIDDWYRRFYVSARTNPTRLVKDFVSSLSSFYSAPMLFLVLVAVCLVPTRRVHVAVAIAAVTALGVLMGVMVIPHYYAPAAGLIVFLATTGMQHIMHGMRKQAVVARALIVLLSASWFLSVSDTRLQGAIPDRSGFKVDRRRIITTLSQAGGNHLVIVRYGANHNPHRDWVHNRANIDDSTIVWAHDMGEVANRQLLNYYPDRAVWLLEPDADPEPRLQRYSTSQIGVR